MEASTEERAARVKGTLIAVVGPSGAGKDTVLQLAREHLAGMTGLVFASRIITRPPHPSEAYEAVDEDEFARRESAGEFLLAWRANSLSYALPASLSAELASGHVVVANLSRAAVSAARQRGIPVLAIEITAERRLLAARIAQRGREDEHAREVRLARNAAYAETFRADIVIENNGTPDVAAFELSETIRIYASR